MSNPFEDLRQAVVVRPMNSPGPQGAAAPHMKVKYSADGTSWHNDPVETDKYLSFSTDNGITWSDAIYFNNLSETLEWVEKARQWAENPENDEVEPGQYSALHHALQAKKSEITAGEYAVDAAGSANEAFGAAAPAWDSATTYNYNDVVSFDNGHTYRCIGSNVTTPPNADGVDDEVNWTRITVSPEGFFEYDTNYDFQPVIAPVAKTGPWMLDELGDIQPRLDPDLAVSELDELIFEAVSKLTQSAKDEITLRSLIANAGSSPMSIIIYADIPITDDLIVPENIELNFKRGGKLSVSATKTLTINGSFSAGLYQVFSGDGSVVFGSGAVKEVSPHWWGNNTIPGTTDMTAAIQAAFTAAGTNGTIIFQPETYLTSAFVKPLDGQTIDLNGATIKGSGSNPLIDISGLDKVRITNGTLDGAIENRPPSTALYCIRGIAATNCLVDRVRFVGWGTGADRTSPGGVAVMFEANDNVSYGGGAIGACYGNIVRNCFFSDEFGSFGVRFLTKWFDPLTTSECYDNHAHHNLFELIGKSAVEIAGHKTHSCSAEYNTVLRSHIDGMDIDKGACDCSISFNSIRVVDSNPLSETHQFGGITVASAKDSVNGSLYASNNRVIGNHIHTTKNVGIRIAGATNTIVQGNTIGESGSIGIYLTTSGDGELYNSNNIIQGNIISGLGLFEGVPQGTTPTGILDDQGINNSIIGNIIND